MTSLAFKELPRAPGRPPSKWKNKWVLCDGRKFQSKREARRYLALKDQLVKGEIEQLRLQRTFYFVINGAKICGYRLDFTYRENGNYIAEDVKGCPTPDNIIKQNLFRAIYRDWELRIT